MGLSSLSILLLALVASPALGAIPEHLIQSLPGWKGALPSKQYSGYIKLDQTSGKNLHYWYVSSELIYPVCVCMLLQVGGE